jgi:hypothetical protein
MRRTTGDVTADAFGHRHRSEGESPWPQQLAISAGWFKFLDASTTVTGSRSRRSNCQAGRRRAKHPVRIPAVCRALRAWQDIGLVNFLVQSAAQRSTVSGLTMGYCQNGRGG